MKKHLLIVLSAVALITTSACNRFETVKGDPLDTRIYTLDNGLQVYMSVNKETPRLQTYIAVRAGGKNGPDTSTGLAHYFEHLMFKGTQQFGTSDYAAEEPLLDEIEDLFNVYRQTTDEAERAAIYHRIDSISYAASQIAIPNEYDKLMAVIGSDGTNAWTSMDETVYTEDIPSNQIENWAKIQSDRFKNVVLRGFHTELETIYEEKNMSLTQDSRKVWEALDSGLFPNHPYGQRTVLGTQEHLKNPSITDVKNFHDAYYVPNNIRICLAGDFDPKEAVKIIEKYFGDWEPNKDLSFPEIKAETPITSPVVKEVYGLEAENVALGWRLPAAKDGMKDYATSTIASYVLYNGMAGLIDLDVMQQQKVLSLFAGAESMADYGEFIAMGHPKADQTLEEVRDIALEEIAKLRAGDFDDSLIPASINQIRRSMMRSYESNASRAQMFIEAFIGGIDWKDYCKQLDYLSAVTKEDVVAFANEYLCDNNYVVVYKRQGVDDTVQKVSAPPITPIVSNRDNQSGFLKEIQASKVKPIEPVYVDFSKDMAQFDITDGVNVLYKKNETNGLFQLTLTYNYGIVDNPALALAGDYISYLGTADMSAEQFAAKMYELACDASFRTSTYSSSITLSGLSENMAEALALFENLVINAQADENILSGVKSDILKSRANSLKNQNSCFSALYNYVVYGEEYIKSSRLSNKDLQNVTSEDIFAAVREVLSKGHEVSYYGPMNESEFKDAFACHYIAEGAAALPERYAQQLPTGGNKVYLAQYDANQIRYRQISNRAEKFQPEIAAKLSLYNEYFGGGMNTIVFQEMREARGLAYSANARLYAPEFADDTYQFEAFIATQNDKTQTAIEAFDEIINDMPASEAAFSVAKESLTTACRTNRIIKASVLNTYKSCRRLGLSEPTTRQIFEGVQNMTLDDVVSFQQEWIKGRDYNYVILGDIKDLDMKYLKTLGDIEIVPIEKAFGY
ncbi:MAG: insulinase family protein [Bacteroidia bacterium]|nr:insulinase family protein [Bacteroidia bacterium]